MATATKDPKSTVEKMQWDAYIKTHPNDVNNFNSYISWKAQNPTGSPFIWGVQHSLGNVSVKPTVTIPSTPNNSPSQQARTSTVAPQASTTPPPSQNILRNIPPTGSTPQTPLPARENPSEEKQQAVTAAEQIIRNRVETSVKKQVTPAAQPITPANIPSPPRPVIPPVRSTPPASVQANSIPVANTVKNITPSPNIPTSTPSPTTPPPVKVPTGLDEKAFENIVRLRPNLANKKTEFLAWRKAHPSSPVGEWLFETVARTPQALTPTPSFSQPTGAPPPELPPSPLWGVVRDLSGTIIVTGILLLKKDGKVSSFPLDSLYNEKIILPPGTYEVNAQAAGYNSPETFTVLTHPGSFSLQLFGIKNKHSKPIGNSGVADNIIQGITMNSDYKALPKIKVFIKFIKPIKELTEEEKKEQEEEQEKNKKKKETPKEFELESSDSGNFTSPILHSGYYQVTCTDPEGTYRFHIKTVKIGRGPMHTLEMIGFGQEEHDEKKKKISGQTVSKEGKALPTIAISIKIWPEEALAKRRKQIKTLRSVISTLARKAFLRKNINNNAKSSFKDLSYTTDAEGKFSTEMQDFPDGRYFVTASDPTKTYTFDKKRFTLRDASVKFLRLTGFTKKEHEEEKEKRRKEAEELREEGEKRRQIEEKNRIKKEEKLNRKLGKEKTNASAQEEPLQKSPTQQKNVSSQEAEQVRAKFNKQDSPQTQKFNRQFGQKADVSEGQFKPVKPSSEPTNSPNTSVNNLRSRIGNLRNMNQRFSSARSNLSRLGRIGRFLGRIGRFAGRAARVVGRLAMQAVRALGRLAVQGLQMAARGLVMLAQAALQAAAAAAQAIASAVAAISQAVAALAANPITWIVVAVIAGLIFLLLGGYLAYQKVFKPLVQRFHQTGEPSSSGTSGTNGIPGLTIKKEGPAQVSNGEDITYTLSVNYSGNLDVTISDTIPTGLAQIIDVSPKPSSNTPAGVPACTFSRGGETAPYQSGQLWSYFEAASQKTGIPAALLAAFARVESTTAEYSISNYTDSDLQAMITADNLNALSANIDTKINGSTKSFCPASPTGALGIMQLEPPDSVIGTLRSPNRSFAQPGAFDPGAIQNGASLLGLNANTLTIQDYCNPQKNIMLAAGFILKKLQYQGYGDGTRWDPSWNSNHTVIDALARSYYGALNYSSGGNTYSYGDDLYNGLNGCLNSQQSRPDTSGNSVSGNSISWRLKDLGSGPNYTFTIKVHPLKDDINLSNTASATAPGGDSGGGSSGPAPDVASGEYEKVFASQGRNTTILGSEDNFISKVVQNGGLAGKEANLRTIYKTSVLKNVNPLLVASLWGEESGYSVTSGRDLGCTPGQAFEQQVSCAVNTLDYWMRNYENGNHTIANAGGPGCPEFTDSLLYALEWYGPVCHAYDSNDYFHKNLTALFKRLYGTGQ